MTGARIAISGSAPTPYHSAIDGIFTGRHHPGLVAMGDIIAVISVEA